VSWRQHPLPPRRPAGTTVLTATGVTVRYGQRRVLDAVDLDVVAGEVLALVGPNGAGKSTLLAVLAGDVRPDAGDVRLDGVPLASWRPRELARRRAVLPQQVTVAFPFTAEQVVRMGRAPWASTPRAAADDAAVASALADVDATAFAAQPFPSLSGGERARVALARVLAQDTGVLLLDEPTAALDLHHTELVLDVVRRRAAAGSAVVVVLHDLGLAAAHADRVAVLDDGRLRATGPPVAVLTPQLLSDVYRHDVDVLAHPRTGTPLVVPRRHP